MVSAIVALVAVLVLAYNKSETFRRIVDSAFRVVAAAARLMVAVVKGVLRILGDAFRAVVASSRPSSPPLAKVLEGPV